jgi:arginine decarboxylase
MLNVLIVSGVGHGETTLSAFDAALAEAGIHNFNIIKVSSILPRGWGIKAVYRYDARADEYGQRLYVVMAEIRTDRIGTTIGAGLGWYQAEDGRGLFAEHVDQIEGRASTEAERNVASKIHKTIRDLCAVRDWPFDEDRLRSMTVSSPVDEKPTSVLVAGVYSAKAF